MFSFPQYGKTRNAMTPLRLKLLTNLVRSFLETKNNLGDYLFNYLLVLLIRDNYIPFYGYFFID